MMPMSSVWPTSCALFRVAPPVQEPVQEDDEQEKCEGSSTAHWIKRAHSDLLDPSPQHEPGLGAAEASENR